MFVVSLTDGYTTHESHLARIDFNGWTPGKPVTPEIIFTFDDRVRGLNGGCMLGPGVMALADCFAGLIWRVDLGEGARSATAPGLAGRRHHGRRPGQRGPAATAARASTASGTAPQTGYLYYTSTAQKVFMRVPVDPATLDPAGGAQFVAAIDNADDFCLDEDAGFAYVTRHRANTLDRVPLAPRHDSEVRHIAGDPFDPCWPGRPARSGDAARRPRPGHVRDHRRRHHRTPGRHRAPGLAAARRTPPGLLARAGELARSTGPMTGVTPADLYDRDLSELAVDDTYVGRADVGNHLGVGQELTRPALAGPC